jgi:hypothetical protein
MFPINQMIQMMQQRGDAFRNPEQQVRSMLNNGQMSQEQFNAIDAQVRQTMQNPQQMQQFQQNPAFMQLFNSLLGRR